MGLVISILGNDCSEMLCPTPLVTMPMNVTGLHHHGPVELSAMMDVIYSVLSNMVATSHVWLLSTQAMASVTKELSF